MSDEGIAAGTSGGTAGDSRSCFGSLVRTDLAYKAIAFVVLTPALTLSFRGMLAASGESVLTDTDILSFALGPAGAACLAVFAACSLTVFAVEQVSLTGVLAAARGGRRPGVPASLWFGFAHCWPVIGVTVRIIGVTLLTAIPFLGVGLLAYRLLLTGHDINFYLDQKPPIFYVTLTVGGVILMGMAAVLLRLFTGWFFALPLVCLEGLSASRALRLSRERASGHRLRILLWLFGWGVGVMVLSSLATGLVGAVGRWIVPEATGSLSLLAAGLGAVLLLGAAIGLAVNVFATTTFAAVLFRLYRKFGSDGRPPTPPVGPAGDGAAPAGLRLTLRRLLAIAIGGVTIAGILGVLTLRNIRVEDDIRVIAHRGASAEAPENTLSAVRRAIEAGADWVEIDVQETADGEVVVFHDSDFMRLSGRDLKIWDATTEDLETIDVGGRFAPEFAGERVPTLGEVLAECRGKIGLLIELKYYGHDDRLERRVAESVDSHDMASQVMVMSLKREGVRKMKTLRPDWKVGLLMSVSAGDVRKTDADFLAVNAAFTTDRLIRDFHAAGKEVYVWTVNDPLTISSLASRGADGVITDRPAVARSVLNERASLGTPERLMLELAGLFGATPEIGEP